MASSVSAAEFHSRMESIGVNLRVTAHSSQGGRKYMEDMFCVAYQPTSDGKDLLYAYFGIFDGHGGREAALFAKQHLMDHIVSQKEFWSDDDQLVLKAIRNGFLRTHHAMLNDYENWPKTLSGLPSTSGTTASIGFVRRGKMYIGHVGDSGIILGYQEPGQGYWRARPLTQDHKPDTEAELQRITEAGGKVINKSGVPRVVWNRARVGHQGPIRRSTSMDEIPFLAVARSLGDLWSYNAAKDKFVVSPEPDVSVVEIDVTTHRCFILGSDGLWNMMNTQDAVNSVYFAEKNNERQLLASPQNTPTNEVRNWINPSRRLVDRALERWEQNSLRADNTSVVTVVIDPPGPPKAQVLRQSFQKGFLIKHSKEGAAGRLPLPIASVPVGDPIPNPICAEYAAAPRTPEAAPRTPDATPRPDVTPVDGEVVNGRVCRRAPSSSRGSSTTRLSSSYDSSVPAVSAGTADTSLGFTESAADSSPAPSNSSTATRSLAAAGATPAANATASAATSQESSARRSPRPRKNVEVDNATPVTVYERHPPGVRLPNPTSRRRLFVQSPTSSPDSAQPGPSWRCMRRQPSTSDSSDVQPPQPGPSWRCMMKKRQYTSSSVSSESNSRKRQKSTPGTTQSVTNSGTGTSSPPGFPASTPMDELQTRPVVSQEPTPISPFLTRSMRRVSNSASVPATPRLTNQPNEDDGSRRAAPARGSRSERAVASAEGAAGLERVSLQLSEPRLTPANRTNNSKHLEESESEAERDASFTITRASLRVNPRRPSNFYLTQVPRVLARRTAKLPAAQQKKAPARQSSRKTMTTNARKSVPAKKATKPAPPARRATVPRAINDARNRRTLLIMPNGIVEGNKRRTTGLALARQSNPPAAAVAAARRRRTTAGRLVKKSPNLKPQNCASKKLEKKTEETPSSPPVTRKSRAKRY